VVPAGPARKWVTAAIVVGVIVLVWFVLAAPGCGSGDTGTDTGAAPGAEPR
jgi:hypothetical protein